MTKADVPMPAGTSHQPAVSITGVTFGYGAQPILADVDFTVMPGESVCIVGPNGGGKTTLLKLILGLLEPQQGSVRVFGQSPAAARLAIGYVPQYAYYDPQFPVTAFNVVLMGRLGGRIGGFYSARDKESARQALGLMHLEAEANELFARLSGGQRQRVLIARALAGESRLLILDEPTANIDAASESGLFEILSRFANQKTILMVTHDVGFAAKFFKRIVCVNRSVTAHTTADLTGTMINELYGRELHMICHDEHCRGGGHPR